MCICMYTYIHGHGFNFQIHHERIRELRKIAKARLDVDANKTTKRDIIDEYANYASKVLTCTVGADVHTWVWFLHAHRQTYIIISVCASGPQTRMTHMYTPDTHAMQVQLRHVRYMWTSDSYDTCTPYTRTTNVLITHTLHIFTPQTYAPIKREGLRIDKDAHKVETTCLDDLKYPELLELENSIPKSMTHIRIERPKMNKFKWVLVKTHAVC